uniref:Diacylglycerol kinase n=1 Tax=Octopus bimaculoides TaxID=37653 RepID=A0A0L8GK21_OCTBM
MMTVQAQSSLLHITPDALYTQFFSQITYTQSSVLGCATELQRPFSSIKRENPVAHCWSEPGHFKRKFCNVCRKRLEDSLGIRCEICEYYAHIDCQDFVVSDCKECATYIPQRDLTSSILFTKSVEIADRWIEHFSKLLNHESVTDETVIDTMQQRPIIGSLDSSPSIDEVMTSISKLNLGRAPGKDRIYAEVLQFGGNYITQSLHELISAVWGDGAIPKDWKDAIILPLHKRKGARTMCGNYRGIALLSAAGKVLANILLTRLNGCLVNDVLSESQCSFRSECLAGMRWPWIGSLADGMYHSSVIVALPAHVPVTRGKQHSSMVIASVVGLAPVQAHATCYKHLPEECNFGSLREIMLPSSCLTIPRLDVSMETLLGLNNKKFTRTVSEEWSSSGDSKDDEERERRSPREKDGKDKDKDSDAEIIRVFDGNNTMKRRLYRTISVNKNAPTHVILEAALKTFHISDDPKNYYVTEASEYGEKELDENSPFRLQLTTPDGKRPSIFLRYKDKDPDKGYIKVYSGGLKVSVGSKFVPINKDTTTDMVIRTALRKFGLEKNPEKYNLIEVLLDKGVSERMLDREERPWELIQQARKDSLRQNRMTRFYIQQTEDPHGPTISLFVGNLPCGLSQRQYEKILLDIIGPENKWHSFDVIYYEYGALVLIYNTAEKASRSFHILRDTIFDDKQLLAMLLPNIQSHMIPDNGIQPLLVFVNVKSGGCQGTELITSFRKLLNPHQVFNLEAGGPLPGLYVFRNVSYYKILVCGGDGTVGWVLSCLDNVCQDAVCQSPPLAIIPLGTGNDLARVLRWGPGYTGGEDPLNLLRDVIDAEEIKLDRWTVIFHPNEKEMPDETKVAIANDTNSANTNEDNTTMFVMNNYFGIGIDADLCLDFHMAREEKPDKFNSRLHNKGVYIKMGLRKMVNKKACKDLHRCIKLEVDGKLIDLPPVEGIIILNILSWGSGANPWGPEKEDSFNKPTHYDGMLEVVGVTGVVHMGQIQSGLRNGIRIAQGGHLWAHKRCSNIKGRLTGKIDFVCGKCSGAINTDNVQKTDSITFQGETLEVVDSFHYIGDQLRITLLTDLPVQVDGEPWIQPAGQVMVLRSALKATMLKKSKNKIKRRNTEPSIFFPDNEQTKTTHSPNEESRPL